MNRFDHLWIEKYLFYVVVVVVVVELVLYVHGQQLRSCRDSQLSYPHCSWASLPEAGYQYVAPILSQITEKCSSWISGRGKMTEEIFSLPNLHEKMCQTRGSIAVPLDSQATSLPTERICFRARFKKTSVYPCTFQFYCRKVGCKRVTFTLVCYTDENSGQH